MAHSKLTKPVTKAVIAAAGFGTRFLPQTKAMPKEMMPLIDKPIIQYVVEELVQAGIKDVIIIGSSNKRAIEDHFDLPGEDLLNNLRAGGAKKQPYIDEIERISNLANFIYVRQKGPYGNATPVACAAHLIGDEPFIYTWADDFFVASPGRTQQLVDTYATHNGMILPCKKIVLDDEYNRFGVVAGTLLSDKTIQVMQIVEKPGKAAAPSDLGSVSGFLLTPAIFPYIEAANAAYDGTGELMIQPIIQKMIDDGHACFAREIRGGTFYDTGDKLEYLKTVIDFGLAHEELGQALRDHLKSRLES